MDMIDVGFMVYPLNFSLRCESFNSKPVLEKVWETKNTLYLDISSSQLSSFPELLLLALSQFFSHL
jgi:hypothetical protein